MGSAALTLRTAHGDTTPIVARLPVCLVITLAYEQEPKRSSSSVPGPQSPRHGLLRDPVDVEAFPRDLPDIEMVGRSVELRDLKRDVQRCGR